MATEGFLLIWNHHKCLSQLFLLHLNTYVMDHYTYFNYFSVVTVFMYITYEDGPCAEGVNHPLLNIPIFPRKARLLPRSQTDCDLGRSRACVGRWEFPAKTTPLCKVYYGKKNTNRIIIVNIKLLYCITWYNMFPWMNTANTWISVI